MIEFLHLQWCLLRHSRWWTSEYSTNATDGNRWRLQRCSKCGSISVWRVDSA